MVSHFGYAQPTKYIEYKLLVSGHRPEFRRDWFAEKWLKNGQYDLHPVVHPNHWMPVDFDKSKLPEILKSHPFYSIEIIK